MPHPHASRRDFLHHAAAATAGVFLAELAAGRRTMADETRSPNERPLVGAIGVGGRGTGIAAATRRYGELVAVADVDRDHAERARQQLTGGKATVFDDYRKLLDRKDIAVVTIGTPDHWHTKICLDALRAGKDVYCEKPLTLTIDEGKRLCKAVKETGRVLQVGTQQRSEFNNRFLTAVALVRQGRLGNVRRVTCAIGGAPSGGPFRKTDPPPSLNWDTWLGQTPQVDYIKERCHNNFRWWYEYSGGKLTDWGAHHVDIAQWAIGMEESGPVSVEVVAAKHPVEFKNGQPTTDDRYNTATDFLVRCRFANGVELVIRHDTENGVTFKGDQSDLFVSRGQLTGPAADELKTNPIAEKVFLGLRKGKRLDSQMGNFFECVRDRAAPVSDVFTHHRALTTCHLANIALRLGRKLTWDPRTEQVVGDAAANAWQGREQRKGYEVT